MDIDSLLNELGVKPDDAPDAFDAETASAPEEPVENGADAAAAPAPIIDDAPDDVFGALDEIQREVESLSDDVAAEEPERIETEDETSEEPAAREPRAPRREVMGSPGLRLFYRPESEDVDEEDHLCDLLVERGVADAKQIAAARTLVDKSPGTRLLDVLLSQDIDEAEMLKVYAEANGLGFERVEFQDDDDDSSFDGVMLQRLGIDVCKHSHALPLRTEGGCVVLGCARPDDVLVLEELRLTLKAEMLRVVVTPTIDIMRVLDVLGAEPEEDVDVEDILGDIEEDDVQVQEKGDDEVDLEREAGESPVIRYVNYIIQTAVKEGASDIHIEPSEKQVKVRFRIDGVLFEMMQPPAKMAAAITSRLKIMANLDIAERRLPQDGRIRCQVKGRKLDLRMSTLPTGYGEKTVMRILDTKSINVSLDDLGFDEDKLVTWKNQVDQPHGIVLVTGPTGSGKTTTLYASLRQLDKVSKNISTVEDPIEYHLDGITQTQTHERIGMTFAKALKSLLRQDPDIIMIGEIRDEETAHTAVQAALTGHLVLSTLHTNDAPSAITRLVNIGLEPFLIGAAVNAVLAQRLVRRICANCSAPADYNEELREFVEMQGLSADVLQDGAGCERCRRTGYQGRVGIYELLVIDDMLRDVIARNPNVTEFRRTCIEAGMTTLRQDGFSKVRQGRTTVHEIIRVTEACV